MDLYILRHGKAEDAGHGISDADRKLTKKGREEIIAIAQWMAAQELSFDLIAASPLARAQETAALVAGVLGTEKMATWQVLVPGGSPDEVCRETGKFPEDATVLLVGHEPLLSTLVGRIIAGNDDAGIVMTKGGLAKIRNYSFHQRPEGELHWLLTAKQMIGSRS
jgi:phosphohistidine phosphatase